MLDKLDLKANIATTLTIVEIKPQEGESQYGTWHRYKVREGDTEYSWFANDYCHNQIQSKGLSNGAIVTVTKKEAPEGKGFLYDIFAENETKRPLKEQEFAQSLDDMDANSKDMVITRTAILKSMIEGGRKEATDGFFDDAEKFINFCLTGKKPMKYKDHPDFMEPTSEDIKEADNPF